MAFPKTLNLVAASIIALTPVMIAPAVSAQGRGPANVFVDEVERVSFANRVEALGTLEPNERAELTLNAADRVTAVYFEDGERVEEGETLISLAQREQAALVEAAQANYDEARKQYERLDRLAEQDAVSQSEVDAARRNSDSARANLRAVQSRQSDRVLVAPFAGVLGFRQVSVGSYVQPGDVVATLIDDSEMRLEFSVPSLLLSTLEPGLEVEATTRDLPGKTFTGALTSIDNMINPVTRSVRVRARLPNEDRVLKAGMFMTVVLKADPRDVPAVPEEAVQPRGPLSFVYEIEENGDGPIAVRREVQTGQRQEGLVEIVSGIEVGDRIVTEGLIGVRDGAAVKIMDRSIVTPSAGGAVSGASSAAAPG